MERCGSTGVRVLEIVCDGEKSLRMDRQGGSLYLNQVLADRRAVLVWRGASLAELELWKRAAVAAAA